MKVGEESQACFVPASFAAVSGLSGVVQYICTLHALRCGGAARKGREIAARHGTKLNFGGVRTFEKFVEAASKGLHRCMEADPPLSHPQPQHRIL